VAVWEISWNIHISHPRQKPICGNRLWQVPVTSGATVLRSMACGMKVSHVSSQVLTQNHTYPRSAMNHIFIILLIVAVWFVFLSAVSPKTGFSRSLPFFTLVSRCLNDVSKSVNNHPQTNGCQIHKRKIGKREVPIKKPNPLRSQNSRSQDLPSQYWPMFLHAERIKKKLWLYRLNVTCAALTPARGTHQWCKICLAPFLRPKIEHHNTVT